MSEVLVLNIDFQPMGRITWQRAVTQWVKGRAEIVESYEGCDIRSVTFSMKMPAVVRELSRYKRKSIIKFSRENVYARDKGHCQYCNVKVSRSESTYDHVTPRGHGGKTKWENIVIACFTCNQRKRNRTPDQAGMKLLSTPVRPKSLSQVLRASTVWKNDMPIEWQLWMGDHWNVDPDQDNNVNP